MQRGKYLIELAIHISARNVSFYLDSYEAMHAIHVQDRKLDDDPALPLMQELIKERGLQESPREAIEALLEAYSTNGGVKSIGRFILRHLRLGKFLEKADPMNELPFLFLNYSVVEDLLIRGHGPWYILVENFLQDIDRPEAVELLKRYSNLDHLVKGYIPKDMAAIFLGYSLLGKEGKTLVPFPANKGGFVARLFRDAHELYPLLSLQ